METGTGSAVPKAALKGCATSTAAQEVHARKQPIARSAAIQGCLSHQDRHAHERQAEHDQPEREGAGQTRIDAAFVRPAR